MKKIIYLCMVLGLLGVVTGCGKYREEPAVAIGKAVEREEESVKRSEDVEENIWEWTTLHPAFI